MKLVDNMYNSRVWAVYCDQIYLIIVMVALLLV
jgi:hypothetical protein